MMNESYQCLPRPWPQQPFLHIWTKTRHTRCVCVECAATASHTRQKEDSDSTECHTGFGNVFTWNKRKSEISVERFVLSCCAAQVIWFHMPSIDGPSKALTKTENKALNHTSDKLLPEVISYWNKLIKFKRSMSDARVCSCRCFSFVSLSPRTDV